MNFRALTLIVLMVTWIAPANGYGCATDSTAVAAHGHEQDASSHSHAIDVTSHGHAVPDDEHHHRVEATFVGSPAETLEAVFEKPPTCCVSGPAAPTVEAAVKNADPRPKSSIAVLPIKLALVRPAARSATNAQLRSRQRPTLPYEKSRRPLLI